MILDHLNEGVHLLLMNDLASIDTSFSTKKTLNNT